MAFKWFSEYEDCMPEHTAEALDNYLTHGWVPGGFLCAVLAGDLFRATTVADTANRELLYHITRWVMHNAPHGSWGSYEQVNDWSRDAGGIRTRFVQEQEKKRMWAALKNTD